MWRYTGHCLLVFGGLGILIGALTVPLFPKLYDYIMKTQMELKPGSYSFEMWSELPIPMYMKVFYFNCTNPDEVTAGTEKPLLKQVGPYTFREEHFKENIIWNDNGTVSFQQRKTWHFESDMSEGVSLDDMIYIVNIIALSAAEFSRWPDSFAKEDFPFLRIMMDQTFKQNNETFFTKVRVGNLTFDGIDSPLLHMGEGTFLDGAIIIPFDRFGWFYGRNNSADYDGWFEMYTGTDDIQKVGQISQWQNETNLDRFFPKPCSTLTGSAGEFFPQHRDKTSISYFTPDLCRSIFFNYKEETEILGVPGYRYHLDSNFIGNSSVNSSNACYNPYPDLVPTPLMDGVPALNEAAKPLDGMVDIGLITGLLNVSSCKFNSPAYVSYPHFFQADPILLEQFHPDSDLHPNELEHSSSLTLMPEQGIPLDVSIRLQINILVRPLPYISMLENVTTTFYPMIWFETTTQVTEDLASQLRLLTVVPYLGDYIGYSSIGLGIVLVLVGIFAIKNKLISMCTNKTYV